MTEDEITVIAVTAAREAVRQTLTSLGIDTNNPIETQHNMAGLKKVNALLTDDKYLADQLHLRKWRTAMESASTLSFKAVIGVLVTGLLGLIILGVQQTLGR